MRTKDHPQASRDAECDDRVITKVDAGDDGWSVTADGWTLWVDKPDDVEMEPAVGSIMRQWGGGIGFTVRGVAIDGVIFRYRTAEEDRENHRQQVENADREKQEKWRTEGRAEQDTLYATLDPIFKDRLDRFRAARPDEFRWQYEGYEGFICSEAQKIARWIREQDGEPLDLARAFEKMPYAEQVEAVGMDDGHSGNTFGASVRLAYLSIVNPDVVARVPGGLSPLVGSAAYEPPPARDEGWAVTIISCALDNAVAARDGGQPVADSAEFIAACRAWLDLENPGHRDHAEGPAKEAVA